MSAISLERPATRSNLLSGRPMRRRWLLTIVGTLIIMVMLFPLYYTLVASLQPSSTFLANTPGLIPTHPVFSNFSLAASTIGPNILDSLIVSVGVVVLTLLRSLPAAYGLARFRHKALSVVIMILLLAQMVPGISLTIAFFSLFHRLHLLNSFPGLILADSTYAVPFAVLVLRAYLGSLPLAVLEAAKLDGCGQAGMLVRIVLPMSLPGVIAVGLFSFLAAWGDFLFAFTLNAGGSVEPVTLGLYKFVSNFTADWGAISASVLLAAIPSGVFLILAQRWIASGLRAGALSN
jgi:multiple sugar transport system permease protein